MLLRGRVFVLLGALAIGVAALWVVQIRRADSGLDAELWEYLHLGFAKGVVRALADGADANSTDEHGYPATWFVAAIADPLPMQMLIEAGATANDMWIEGKFPGEFSRIIPFGGKAGHRDATGWMMEGTLTTPLAIAAKYGNYQTALVLLEAGAEIRPWNNTDESVLHLAVLGKSTQLVQVLIDQGAVITDDDLIIACILSDIEMARILLANGANVNSVDHGGTTALVIAWKRNWRDDDDRLLRLLLESSAIPSPWMLESATKSNDQDMVSLLQANLENQGKLAQDIIESR